MTGFNPNDSKPVEDALRRVGAKFFTDRVMAAIRAVCVSNTASSGYSDIRVDKGFPSIGEFQFTRDADGRRFTFRLELAKWVCRGRE